MSQDSSEKRGRGRQKGAVSFMQVNLCELNRILKPDAKVVVSLRYGTLVGLQGKPVGADMQVIDHCVNSGKIDMNIENFDDFAPINDLKKDKKDEGDDDNWTPPLSLEITSFED
jgi:hypothetical protein